jgi:ubiquinone biosynthesis protein COQ9
MERDEVRLALIKATLPEVPFEGWSPAAFRAAARELGLAEGEIERAFPGGVREAIEYWSALADDEMLAELEAVDMPALKVRERVAVAVKVRLMQAAPHREALRRALSLLALPTHAGMSARMLYRTVDAIWYAAGDRSTDHNFYTKRGLLAGVYGATVLYWLDDQSEGFEETWGFLDRRLGDVMRLPQLLGRVTSGLGRLPNPLRFAQRLSGRFRPV